MTSTHEQGPVARSIETKIQQLQPVSLAIINDSHKHAHHEAMRGQQPKSSETHFRLEIVSDAFQGKTLLQRHRLIYDMLAEEMKEGGVHALQLVTKTPSELKH